MKKSRLVFYGLTGLRLKQRQQPLGIKRQYSDINHNAFRSETAAKLLSYAAHLRSWSRGKRSIENFNFVPSSQLVASKPNINS